MTEGEHENCLVLHNRQKREVDLWIEPWGDKVSMHPESSYYLLGVGGLVGQSFEVEFRDNDYCVHGWTGSVLFVYDENQNQIWHCPVPSP